MKQISFRNDVLPLKNQLYRLALRITMSRDEAEDIVQDTLVKVWDMRDNWSEIDSIEALSMTICRNLSLDHIKKMDNQHESLDYSPMERADSSDNPYEQALHSDSIRLVRQIIDQLPEKQRSCMQLRDFEGKSYKEIASVMQITEEQVKVNIFRARQSVKQQFKKLDNYGL